MSKNSRLNELSDVIRSKEIDADELTAPCDNGLFLALAKQILSHEEIGYTLGLTKPDIEHINKDHKETKEKIMAVLFEWRRKVGSSQATHLVLVEALLNMDDRDTAEFVLDHILHQQNVLKESWQEHARIPFTPQLGDSSKYCDWSSLGEKEQEQIKSELLEENEKVKFAFGSVIIKLLKSFEENKVDFRRVKIYLRAVFSSVQHDLERCNDLVDLFEILAKHRSWYNFELLECVVNEFGTQADKEILNDYITNVLQPYLKRSIFEIPPSSLCNHYRETESLHLHLKLPDHDLSLSGVDVKLIQIKLAKRLKMNVGSFELCSYCAGCIELEFALEIDTNDKQKMMLLNECAAWNTNKGAYTVALSLLEILFDSAYTQEILIIQKLIKTKEDKIEELMEVCDNAFISPSSIFKEHPMKLDRRTGSDPSYVRFIPHPRSTIFQTKRFSLQYEYTDPIHDQYDYTTVKSLVPEPSYSTFKKEQSDAPTASTVPSSYKFPERIVHKQMKNWLIPCNRSTAEKMLAKKEDGTFLCRGEKHEALPSGGIHTHTIDLVCDGSVKHFKVIKFKDKYGLSGSRVFDSLQDLVSYYSQNSLDEYYSKSKQVLAFPVKK